jgi:HEAT repeat protein
VAKDLAKKLIAARAEDRSDILSEFELAQGTDFSYELAKAIPELSTKQAKDASRDVLAKRMARQSVKTIEAYLKEEDPELRLAATRGAGLKKDKDATPVLIPLLEDRDVSVQDAALDSLKTITGQNHGKSIARWSRWFDMQKK